MRYATLLRYLIAVSTVVLTASACEQKKKLGRRTLLGNTGTIDQAAPDSADAESKAASTGASVDTFAITLYPVLRDNCGVCHGDAIAPLIALPDAALAHDALLETAKVNLEAPDLSRIYLKVADEGHNCWGDCKDNGNVILDAIVSWAKLTTIKENANEPKLKTTALNLGKAEKVPYVSTDPRTIVYEAESMTVTGAMQKAANIGANAGSMIYVPNTVLPDTLDAPEDSMDGATIQVDIKQAGSYMIYARTSAPTDMDNGFFITVDGQNFETWAPPMTSADEFVWQRINTNDGDDPVAPMDLTPGPLTIEVKRRDSGTMLDMIAITSNPVFAGSDVAVGSVINVLKYDISELCGVPGVTFSIEVFERGLDAYKLKNPSVEVKSGSVKVKGIYLFLNNFFNPQYATYSLIDNVVSSADPTSQRLSESSMIVIREKGSDDTFGFGFESCSSM